MSRLLWATDIHLDAAERRTIEPFCTRVNRESAAALLLGGDMQATRPQCTYRTPMLPVGVISGFR